MDREELKHGFRQAAFTLSRLPMGIGGRPSDVRSAWPDMVRQSQLILSSSRFTPPARPAPREIDEMHHFIALLYRLDVRHRRIVWARACGISWRHLQDISCISRTQLHRHYIRALDILIGKPLH